MTPSSDVLAAVAFWWGSDAPPPAVPKVGAWEWELRDGRHPLLWWDASAMDLMGISLSGRDRTTYGVVDFFRRFARISDIVNVLRWQYTSSPGEHQETTVPVVRDNGDPAMLHLMQRHVETAVGPRILGLGRDVSGSISDEDLSRLVLDSALTESVVRMEHNRVAAVFDLHLPTTPIAVKWIPDHPALMGQGASTGQAPGLHPDDAPRVLELIRQGRERHGVTTVSETVRVRSITGKSWVRWKFKARRILPSERGIVVAMLELAEDPASSERTTDTGLP